MKSQNTKATAAQGANVATTIANTPAQADLFAMFQAFIAAQAAQPAPAPVVTPSPEVPVKSARKAGSKKAAEQAPAKEVNKAGVHVHKLENSFFVYGDGAPAKLAAFFEKKPHLNRGFKAHEIKGVGTVKAFWFGGRQYAKVMKFIA